MGLWCPRGGDAFQGSDKDKFPTVVYVMPCSTCCYPAPALWRPWGHRVNNAGKVLPIQVTKQGPRSEGSAVTSAIGW